MKNNYLLGLVIILGLTILVLLFMYVSIQPSDKNIEAIPEEVAQETTTPLPAAPQLDQNDLEDWKNLKNVGHSFSYPPEAKAETRDEESLVTFMGQKQIDSGRTQTELFDGYSFKIGMIENPSNLPLNELAQNEHDNAVSNCNYGDGKVSQLSPITIDGQQGYQYSALNCYIDYTESIISSGTNFYRISQSYAGDASDQAAYKTITETIFSSLKFE